MTLRLTVIILVFLTVCLDNFVSLLQEKEAAVLDTNDDVDGIPLEEDVDGLPFEEDTDMNKTEVSLLPDTSESKNPCTPVTKFKPSKWETVDPDIVESQAMTTSKWEQIQRQSSQTSQKLVVEEDEDIGGVPFTSSSLSVSSQGESRVLGQDVLSKDEPEKRIRLREVEVLVVKFQDDLESGRKRRVFPHLTLEDEVEEYRKELIRRMDNVMSPSFCSSLPEKSSLLSSVFKEDERSKKQDKHRDSSNKKRKHSPSRSPSRTSSFSSERSR